MRTLGLIGGTSWHSTIEYYRNINHAVNQHHGDNTNPPLVLYNLNQALVHRYQRQDNWQAIAEMVIAAGQALEKAGAQALMCCANTPHKVYPQVDSALDVPVLHIADATAQAIQAQSLSKVCFIGTRFSMEEDFVTGRIAESGIKVLVPEQTATIIELHRIVQQELTFGEIKPESKAFVLDAINQMIDRGAQGVVLGCTEFPLMIKDADLQIPAFDTTEVHSKAAVRFVLGQDPASS